MSKLIRVIIYNNVYVLSNVSPHCLNVRLKSDIINNYEVIIYSTTWSSILLMCIR